MARLATLAPTVGLTVALTVALGAPWQAMAAVLDDFLSHDYTVVAATRVPGSFTGCIRQHRLVFADGSVFACARTEAHIAYEPRVTILRLAGGPPSVVLVGSHILAGELLRLHLHDYPVPLRMTANPLVTLPARPSGALQPTGATPSINVLTQQQNTSISQQQAQLPQPARKFRSSR